MFAGVWRAAAERECGDVMVDFVRTPDDVTVTEGEDASFECQLLTSPSTVSGSSSSPVSVSWYKDEDLIPADEQDFKQTFDGSVARLYISGTYLDDAGQYTCIATTTDGQHEASITATLVVNGRSNHMVTFAVLARIVLAVWVVPVVI